MSVKRSETLNDYTNDLLMRGDISMGDIYEDDYDTNLTVGLVNIRRECSMTQKDLAMALGTKQPNIARFEGGASLPSHEMIKKIARVLGVRPIAPGFEKVAAYTSIQLIRMPTISSKINTYSNTPSISFAYVGK
jgi:DNA-binding XRE family transcriptional regulator